MTGWVMPWACKLSAMVGANLESLSVQPGLDFLERIRELFEEQEMGEDVMWVLKDYVADYEKLARLMARVQPLLSETAKCAKQF